MEQQELQNLVEKLILISGVKYGYDEHDNYIDIDDGTPCPYNCDYRERYFRIYLDILEKEMWCEEFCDKNSYLRFNSKNIHEISIYNIIDIYVRKYGYDEEDFRYLNENKLDEIIDEIIEDEVWD